MKTPIVAIVLLAVVGYFVYRMSQSREWAQFHSEHFWRSLVQLRLSNVLLAALFIFTSYFFRSLRWRAFLKPIKTAGVGNIFVATIVGFSAVALLGRPGELVRPLLIARKEQLGLSSQFAAWTLERIFDALTIGIFLGVTLVAFPPAVAAGGSAANVMARLKMAGIVVCGGAVVGAVLLLQFRRSAPFLMRTLPWFARVLPERRRAGFQASLGGMLTSFTDGLASIETVGRFGACTGYSLLVWIPVVLTYWVISQSFPGPMSMLGPGAMVVMIAVSVVGSLAQIPGIGGGPQLAMILALTQLFGIPLDIASTAAILLWVICFMVVLLPGLPLAAHEGLNWRRLRAMVSSGGSEDVARLTANAP